VLLHVGLGVLWQAINYLASGHHFLIHFLFLFLQVRVRGREQRHEEPGRTFWTDACTSSDMRA
jgi:hypothetical protein